MNIEKGEGISCLLGDLNNIGSRPVIPFSDTTMAFLEKVSEYIKNLNGQGGNEGLRAFGFWCRRQHLMQLKKVYGQDRERLGLGRIFHIAPSNVPGLFAWSAAIGLLAGNSNIVRVSERNREETERFWDFFKEEKATSFGGVPYTYEMLKKLRFSRWSFHGFVP